GVDGGEEPARVRPVLETVKRVTHAELDRIDGDARLGPQLESGKSESGRLARRIAQLDAPARPRRQLAVDLRAHAELRLDFLQLPARAGLGRVALGEDRVPPRIDDVPGNAVRLAHRR